MPVEPLTLRPAPVRSARRPSAAYATAALLNLASSVFGVVWALPVITAGAADSSQVPWPIVVFGFALSVLGLPSSYGVWRSQRWGVVLTIVLNAVGFVSGAPGIVAGPSTFLVVSSIVGCAVNVLVIYLLLRRGRVRAAARA